MTKLSTGFTIAAALAGVAACVLWPAGAAAQSKVLKFVPQADLRIVDPIWTTAYVTRNHAYMVWDTLFAVDDKFVPKPQMAEGYTLSADKKTYTITLREGLKWHDGQPVKPEDCIASIRRWGKRDAFGQQALSMVEDMKVVDGKTFTITTKQPFPLLIDALAKPSSNVPFMMPERLASTDAFTQIKEVIGSGPFKFVPEEWVPGNKVVYVKNADYVPRKEEPSWGSGAKIVKVDRAEWVYIPDPATAAAALNAGEVDWYEQPPVDILPVFARNRDVVVVNIDPIGSIGMIRFNHLNPPFDNPKMRQALLHVVNQEDYVRAIAGDPKNWKLCHSFFTCGTPMSNEVGTDVLKGKRDLAKAKQLIQEAGYKGEKIVILSATDQPIVHAQGLVTHELLRGLGLNVQLDANDWGTLITRRASKEPIDKGGWSIFHTWWVGPDLANPALNAAARGNGANGWFGWSSDEAIEKLRNDWFNAADLDGQKKLAAEMQKRAFETVPYIPTGQFILPTAHRRNLEGVIIAPVSFLWNVEKK